MAPKLRQFAWSSASNPSQQPFEDRYSIWPKDALDYVKILTRCCNSDNARLKQLPRRHTRLLETALSPPSC